MRSPLSHLLAATLLAAAPVVAEAQINETFSGGTTPAGWTATGWVDYSVGYAALVSSSGFYGACLGGQNCSILTSPTFTVGAAGAALSFDANFTSNEDGIDYNDYGTVRLYDFGTSGYTSLLYWDSNAIGGSGASGWSTTNALLGAGTYALVAESGNGGDSIVESYLDLDNVVVAPMAAVPEPGTYALLATGLAGIAGVARRRRAA